MSAIQYPNPIGDAWASLTSATSPERLAHCVQQCTSLQAARGMDHAYCESDCAAVLEQMSQDATVDLVSRSVLFASGAISARLFWCQTKRLFKSTSLKEAARHIELATVALWTTAFAITGGILIPYHGLSFHDDEH